MAVYTTQGTCSRKISFDIIDGKIHNVSFMGGDATETSKEFLL